MRMRDIMNLVEDMQPRQRELTDAFWNWFGQSKVVDESGKPMVVFHGTGSDIESFRGMVWASVSPALATEYAHMRGQPGMGGGNPNIMPMYMRIERPFNADLMPKTVTIGDMLNAIMEQGMANGVQLDDHRTETAKTLWETIRTAARREESGPHYDRHDFWYEPYMAFGRDGAAAIFEFFKLFGFDGVMMIEGGEQTYGAFTPAQVKSVFNKGVFNPDDPRISEDTDEA